MQTAVPDIPPQTAASIASNHLPRLGTKWEAPSGIGLLLAAAVLGCALQVNFGQYHSLAVLWVTLALTSCALGIVGSPRRILLALERKASWVLPVALGLQFILLLSTSPGATGRLAVNGHGLWAFRAGVVGAALLAIGAILLPSRVGRACLFAMLLTHAGLGTWVLRAAPNPGVDVVTFQRDATRALIEGENPYAITFPNLYAHPDRFYGPGVVEEGRLAFGYPYPPLSLLMALPGHLFGDFRYAQLIAMTLAGALIAFARPGRLATGAAALLLFTPRGFFVLEAGWTEPFAVLLLAASVFVTCRRPSAVALPLGLLVAVKQYLVLALLLTPLLPTGIRQRRSALVWKALAVAAAVTLPLALWDLTAFIRSVVLLQFRQPFRDDALSYLAAIYHATGWQLPAWIAFALAAATIALCLRRCPRTPAGFAAALGLVCFVFFAFNKQAFCNYYHFVIGALCCAAGASPATPEPALIASVSA